MGLAGNLRTMPFADLLQFLNANQSTGTLQIRQKQIVKMIFFEKGKIISSSSSDPKEYLGHFLVSHGLLTEEELRLAMEIQRTSKMLLGKILVAGGKIDESQMSSFLKLKAEETVYSIFLWDEGEFTFYQDEFINRLFIRISLNPQSMIFEGVLRRDEWERIREQFPHNNVILEIVPKNSPNQESMDAQMKVNYSLVNGQRTIDDIILASHSVEYKVCNALHQLYENGYLRIKNILGAPVTDSSGRLGGDYTAMQLLALGKENFEKGRYEEALDILRSVSPNSTGYLQKVVPLLDQAERETIRQLTSVLLQSGKVVKVLIPLNQFAHAGLTPEEGFMLSRIDGTWDINAILSVTPMKEVDALRLMKKLLDRGIIGIA
jgi:Domain of unknown function (DUF4388)